MKIPRVRDFDPNAKASKLKSSMDGFPTIEKPKQVDSEVKKQPVRVVSLTPSAEPNKRLVKQRHPFDIFQDQYETLRDFSFEEKKGGEAGSMSAMVRDALDKYIAERKRKKLLQSPK